MTSLTDPPAESREREDLIAAFLTAAGLLVSGLFILISPEGLVHFDDLTHYLMARWAWAYPSYLLHDWGRPGFTVLYFPAAWFGWPMCKALSAILTAWSAWFGYRIARGIGLRHAWAVILFAYAQPLFFQLSQTTLTETALAFYLVAAVYLAQRSRWAWSAALLSLGLVTRHEAIVFLPIWVWFAWRGGVGLWRLGPLVWAPAVVNLLAMFAGMKPAVENFFNAHGTAQYGHGSWLTYFSRSLEAWGPGISALAIVGWWTVWKSPRGALAAACILIYFAAETAIRALGLFDSGGYARFLVSISPLIAVAALAGWLRLWDADARVQRTASLGLAGAMILLWFAMERHIAFAKANHDLIAELYDIGSAQRAMRIATESFVAAGLTAALFCLRRGELRAAIRLVIPLGLVVIMALASVRLCGILRRPPEADVIDETLAKLKTGGLGDREIISAVVWMDYAKGYVLSPRRPTVRERLAQAPVGALFAWEQQFAASADHGLQLNEFMSGSGWRLELTTRPAREGYPAYLHIFEKTGEWPGQNSAR